MASTAATLIGAHDVSMTAGPIYGDDVVRLERVREQLTTLLGPDRYATALHHGESLGDQGALTLARSVFT